MPTFIPIQSVSGSCAHADDIPDIEPIDFARVRRAWQRAAEINGGGFEESLLERVGGLLTERLGEIRVHPRLLLDFGSRSRSVRAHLGLLTRKEKFRVVSATFAEGCAASLGRRGWRFSLFSRRPEVLCVHPGVLPFASGTFDAVLCNMALHWVPDRKATLREIRRVLKPDGVFLFATLGAGTLEELRGCLAELDRRRWHRVWPRVPTFPSLHELGDELLGLGYRLPVVDRDVIHPTFKNTHALLQHLRTTGGCNPHMDRAANLTGKGYITDLHRLYDSRHAEGPISATVEILFGHGWRST